MPTLLDTTTASNTNIAIARWGGDDTSRYNYQTNVVNSANDYYFENFSGSNSMLPNGDNGNGTSFNAFLSAANTLGIATQGTAPVIGWVSNSTIKACSFSQSAYPNQKQFNGDGCGNGVASDGTSLFGNNTIAANHEYLRASAHRTRCWKCNNCMGGRYVDRRLDPLPPDQRLLLRSRRRKRCNHLGSR